MSHVYLTYGQIVKIHKYVIEESREDPGILNEARYALL